MRTIMRKLLLGSAALAALMATGTAMAADLVVKPIPPVAPVQYSDWTGVYVGVEGGYGWGNDSFGFGGQNSARVPQDFNTFTAPPVPYCDPTYFARVYNLPLVMPGLDSITTGGFVFGGFLGAQKQSGFWVLGLEVDFDGADITGSGSSTVVTNASTTAQVFRSTTTSFAGPPPYTTTSTIAITPVYNPGAISTTNSTLSVDRKIDDLASVRGKFGFTPWQSLMFYGTAGLALAHQTTDVSFTQTTTGTMIGVASKGVFNKAPTIPFSSW